MKIEKDELKNILGIILFFSGMVIFAHFDNSVPMRAIGFCIAVYGGMLIANSWS